MGFGTSGAPAALADLVTINGSRVLTQMGVSRNVAIVGKSNRPSAPPAARQISSGNKSFAQRTSQMYLSHWFYLASAIVPLAMVMCCMLRFQKTRRFGLRRKGVHGFVDLSARHVSMLFPPAQTQILQLGNWVTAFFTMRIASGCLLT